MRTQQEQARLDEDRKQRWENQQRADKLHAEQLRAETQRQQQERDQARRDQERKQRENQLDTERRNAEFQRRQESEKARLAAQQEQSAQQARESVQRREESQRRIDESNRQASQDQLEKSRYEKQLKATNLNTLVTGVGAAAVAYSIYDTAPSRYTQQTETVTYTPSGNPGGLGDAAYIQYLENKCGLKKDTTSDSTPPVTLDVSPHQLRALNAIIANNLASGITSWDGVSKIIFNQPTREASKKVCYYAANKVLELSENPNHSYYQTFLNNTLENIDNTWNIRDEFLNMPEKEQVNCVAYFLERTPEDSDEEVSSDWFKSYCGEKILNQAVAKNLATKQMFERIKKVHPDDIIWKITTGEDGIALNANQQTDRIYSWNELEKTEGLWHISLQNVVTKDTCGFSSDAETALRAKIEAEKAAEEAAQKAAEVAAIAAKEAEVAAAAAKKQKEDWEALKAGFKSHFKRCWPSYIGWIIGSFLLALLQIGDGSNIPSDQIIPETFIYMIDTYVFFWIIYGCIKVYRKNKKQTTPKA
jgi:hypothetical protein